MNTARIAICVASSLALGAMMGFGFASRRYESERSRFMRDETIDRTFGITTDAFVTVRSLRLGDTNAVFEQWEREVDVGVLMLHVVLTETPGVFRAPNFRALLDRIRAYRDMHPWKSGDLAWDGKVAAALRPGSTGPTP
jgi:hypothetical protein